MNLKIATPNQAALELTGTIVANRVIAEPILRILDHLGGNVLKLQSLDLSVLLTIQNSLPNSQRSEEQTMTLGSTPTQDIAALELTGRIAADPFIAKPILRIIEKLEGDVTKLQSWSQLSPEQILRAENRIQDNPRILADLGFKGKLPPIPEKLLQECVRTGGTAVLLYGTTIQEYQFNLNRALGLKTHLHLYYGKRVNELAITDEEPHFINVPNTVRDESLGRTKFEAFSNVSPLDGVFATLCHPMYTVLMLGYNNLQAGKQLPGFTDKYTYTNEMNTVVGSTDKGIRVSNFSGNDYTGQHNYGVAPCFVPRRRN